MVSSRQGWTLCPGPSVAEKRCKNLARVYTASCIAKFFPRQLRGPAEKGREANIGGSDCLLLDQLRKIEDCEEREREISISTIYRGQILSGSSTPWDLERHP